MPWQKITRHFGSGSVQVESKSGNTYPATCRYDWQGDALYTSMVNQAHDEYIHWGWISFEEDSPTLEDWTRNKEGQGPPEKPPWER